MKKTLKNALITVLLLSCALINSLHAQTDKPAPTKVPDMLQNADYVFEGTVVDTKLYLTKDKVTLYSSAVVRIDKIFKGYGLKSGTINVISEAVEGEVPSTNGEETISLVKPKHGYIPKIEYVGQRGIFVVKIADDNTNNYSWKDVQFDNKIVLSQGNKYERTSVPYCLSCYDGKYVSPWGSYNDLASFYKSIKEFNLKTDFVDRSNIIDDSLANIQYQKELKERKESEARSQQSQKEYALYLDALAKRSDMSKKKLNTNQRNAQAGGNLNIDTRNFTYSTSGNQNFIDFDVYISGTSNTFFDQTLLRFNYSKQIFGDSLYFKGGVTATRGSSLNNINYKLYQGDVINDNNLFVDSVVYFQVGTNDSLARPNRITLTTTAIQLVHLKFKIKNCAPTAKMQFVDIVRMDIFTVHAPHANDSFFGTSYLSYDNVFRTDNSPIPLCPSPKITSFSPSVIRAGTNEVLTIIGKGFGSTRIKGQVLFPDADSLGRYLPACDDSDYVSWNDTIIKVKVPSLIFADSINNGISGSGKFKVKNNLGFRDSTTSNLDVEFGIENSSTKKKVLWAYRNCQNSSFIFKLDTSLQTYPQAVAVIDSAINAWARFLRIDMRLQKDSIGGYQYFSYGAVNNLDTISMLYINNSLSNGTLMSTTPCVVTCGGIPRRQASDIGIKMTGITWHYGIIDTKPSGVYDFYSDILHELGHALGLMHIINPNASTSLTHELELMFWNETLNISKTPAQRSYIGTGRQMDKKASLYIRDTSKTTLSCSVLKPIREFASPSSKVGCVGSAISFTAYCEQLSGSPAPSYTWQHFNFTANQWVNTTTASLLTAVTGQVSATLTITSAPASLNGKIFRCKITNIDACGPVYTQVATLSFNTPTFYTNPTNQNKNEHSNFNLPAQSGDSTLQYKWQQKISGGSVYNDINDGGSFSGTTTQILSINNVPYSFDQSYFRCKGTNTAGCVGYSSAAKITVNPTGFAPSNPTNKSITESKLKIYPNPSSNLITVAIDNKNNDLQSLSILNSAGKEVYKYSFKGSSVDIDISSFPTGLYMVQLNNGISVQNKEFVITR